MRAYVVASDGSAGLLSMIELAGNTVAQRIPLPAPARQVALSADGARAYVTAGGARGSLVVVDLATGTVAARPPPEPERDRHLARRPARLHHGGARRLAIVDWSPPR